MTSVAAHDPGIPEWVPPGSGFAERQDPSSSGKAPYSLEHLRQKLEALARESESKGVRLDPRNVEQVSPVLGQYLPPEEVGLILKMMREEGCDVFQALDWLAREESQQLWRRSIVGMPNLAGTGLQNRTHNGSNENGRQYPPAIAA